MPETTPPDNESREGKLERLYVEYKQSPSRETLGQMYELCVDMSRNLVRSMKRRYGQIDGVHEHEFDEAVEKILNHVIGKGTAYPGKFPYLFTTSLRKRLINVGRDIGRQYGREFGFSNIGDGSEEHSFDPSKISVHDKPIQESADTQPLRDRITAVLDTVKLDSLEMYLDTLEGVSSEDIGKSHGVNAHVVRQRIFRIREKLQEFPGLETAISALPTEEKQTLANAVMDDLRELIATKKSMGSGRG